MKRPETFSLYPELRVMAWGGAMLLASAAGIVLKNNLERIGPLALAVAIGVVAVACYVWVWWHRDRATIADDYVLLLGALLVSADVGFIESQFHPLGQRWPLHVLLLAVVHAVGAYAYGSRMLLSLSIAALAAWMGIERRSIDPFNNDAINTAIRALACAALLLVWRALHRAPPDFLRVFEHFAANLALWSGLLLLTENESFNLGCAIAIVVAVVVMRWGFVQRSEAFVLYGFVYAVIAVDAFVIEAIDPKELAGALWVIFLSMIGAVIALIAIHRRFQESAG